MQCTSHAGKLAAHATDLTKLNYFLVRCMKFCINEYTVTCKHTIMISLTCSNCAASISSNSERNLFFAADSTTCCSISPDL